MEGFMSEISEYPKSKKMNHTEEQDYAFPREVKNVTINFLICGLHYLIEDRRPDLAEYCEKYKHQLTIRFFHRIYRLLFRTDYFYGEIYQDNLFKIYWFKICWKLHHTRMFGWFFNKFDLY